MSTSYALQFFRGLGGGSSSRKPDRDRDREKDVSSLSRWLRDLRVGRSGTGGEGVGLQRANPAYHSEGRGPRCRRHRRHSFNDQPTPTRQRCYSNGFDRPAGATTVVMPNLQPGAGTGASVPVRDTASASLRRAPAAAGHEKFPSWPVPAAAAAPPAARAPAGGGSSRSKSWTEHTEYPKEQPLTYTRPYMKRQHSAAYNKQLKTVLERCEKLGPEVWESRRWPWPDREGKAPGDIDYAAPSPPERDAPPLAPAELEQLLQLQHSKQPSYAQSEGYHSLVSSADSTATATPFLDRLRRDQHVSITSCHEPGRDSVLTTGSSSASGSASSSETLKWHGSLSDVSSVASTTGLPQSTPKRQLIAHSARVQTPQRHHSESVLYIERGDRKLFPVNTYTVQPNNDGPQIQQRTVADRVIELERQQQRYTYLDPEKKHRVSDPTLKAIQKKALLSFYERHHSHSPWRSEPQLAEPQLPPRPPPPPQQPPSRRASCASDYALRRPSLGPVIMGPAISVDDWVPERPPKNPQLRSAYRVPSPDLPPPSPPPVHEGEVYPSDEPLPPPPPAADLAWQPPPPQRVPQRQSFMRRGNNTCKPPPPPPHAVNVEPPPLHPRQQRVNQSMRARIPIHNINARKSLTEHRERDKERNKDRNRPQDINISQSKASYLSTRRERELGLCPGDMGSYKRTMSPSGDGANKEPDVDVSWSCSRLHPTNTVQLVRRSSLLEPTKTSPPLPDVLPRSRLPNTPEPPPPQPTPPPTPPPEQPLQLIQRTEVTLRVNAPTSDAASQTDHQDEEEEQISPPPVPTTPLPTRRKLQEEIDCDRLSQDLANQLAPSDRLKCILVPGPEHRKPTDYVSGLFKVEVTSRPRPNNSPFRSSTSISINSTNDNGNEIGTSTETVTESIREMAVVLEPTSPLSASSVYFTTSESKAKFLTRFSRDMSQYNIVHDTKDLKQKKEELVNRLARKLSVLRSEQRVVAEESRLNDELGSHVERRVALAARPPELAKFRLHVAEVGQITSLLLGLSGRLARAENALMAQPDDSAERKILEDKRDKLQQQLTEAKQLKENIDRRSVSVSNMLYQYLTSEEYADYDHFINMKAKLLMDAREIADKIELGEEQLSALQDTLSAV